ncbi:MAG TPA: enoyl-CoA hydratase-related protein [Stellaceae bacterium]|nr:enoyl-CoA hydratase-related protein [Stellaceae bacterium]
MAVNFARRGEFALVTLDRKEALNALSFAALRDLAAAFDAAAASGARALIITGAGDKAFCAGADIGELTGRSLAATQEGAEFGQSVFQKLDRLPILSLAVVNGYAMGGGLELALACTFRIAVTAARFALPEIKLGLIPGYGGTQRLPRLIGAARALELILSGRTIDATEAERIGLVNRVVDGDPLEAGIAFLRTMTGYSLPVLGFARAAVASAGAMPLAEGLKVEAQLSTLAYQTRDAAEGMSAFIAKRKPVFEDR